MKEETESSLELLLDTMCNTFGGVIFITIALVVIISMTSSLRQKKSDDSVSLKDVEELKVILAELQEQLRQADVQKTDLEEQLDTASSDPRLRMMEEIAALESAVEKRSLLAEVQRTALENSRLEAAVLEKELQNAQDDLQKHSEEIEKDVLARQEVTAQLEALRQEQEASRLNMVFTTMKGRKELPYYLILQNGKVWRVGPDDEELLHPNADVDARSHAMEDGQIQVTCVPKNNAGISVYAGEKLSAEFRQCLASLPGNRVPCFWVTPESAEVFYALREVLKREGKFHGFRLLEDRDSYGYAIIPSKNGKVYEY